MDRTVRRGSDITGLGDAAVRRSMSNHRIIDHVGERRARPGVRAAIGRCRPPMGDGLILSRSLTLSWACDGKRHGRC